MKVIKFVYTIFLLGTIVIVFRNWFLAPEIIGGDWQYLFNEMLREFSFLPLSWDPAKGNGLGGISPIYSLSIYNNFTTFIADYLHISWVIVYKIFWFGLFITLSILSSITLLKNTLLTVKYWQLVIGGIIFTSNTYILMITGGGQMGIALAYAIAPLVLARFIIIVQSSIQFDGQAKYKVKNPLIAGLVLGAQVMFDTRIVYVTMLAVGIYYVFFIKYYASQKNILKALYLLILYVFVIPIGIAVLLHASWIFPILFYKSTLIPPGIISVDGFRFFSFADFSHTFSMLHPNWPENIFGKTYFLKPEFLLLPILAFSSLLFISKIKDQKIKISVLFFAFLGLLGAFIAKGVNPPFGEINQWLFIYIPGMNLFRDSTKFYLLIILSYSVLISFSLWQIPRYLSSIKYQVLIPTTFFVIWLFLIHAAILGQLGGTFQRYETPKEYFVLKDFLHNQPDFFRTLWMPSGVRFNYFSNKHLVVVPELLFGTRDIAVISKILHYEETKIYLQTLGIKYIIVPFDSLGEIFIKNRKYDEKQYKDTIKQLETLIWLKRLNGFGKIAVFEVPNPNDRFWLSGDGNVSYTMINSVEYDLTILATEPQSVIFSENYNPSWIATSDSFTSVSKKTAFGLNSFSLPEKGNYTVKITFSQQKYYKYGQIISMVALISVVLGIIVFQKEKV